MNLTLREVFDRYGPMLAVVAVLAALVALLPGNADGGGQDLASGGGGPSGNPAGGTGSAAGDAGGSVAGAPGTGGVGGSASGGAGGTVTGSTGSGSGGAGGGTTAGGGAEGTTAGAPGAAGTATGAGLGDTKCREDGNMPDFSHYAPKCVPVFTGDNGGATSMGVSPDTIKVVYYFNHQSAATELALQGIGADDPRPQSKDVASTLVRYLNNHYETYKRAVELVFFESAAESDDDAALKADAVQIANEIKPFAVVGATNDVVAGELAARKVICICTVSEPSSFYELSAPYVWNILPEAEEIYQQLAEYIGKRLAGKPAKFAGDLPPGIKQSERKFGLIYQEGSGSRIDPRVKESVAFYEQELAKYGVRLTKKVAYAYDAARGQEIAGNLMAQMADAGVTTVSCFCEPITPIFFTKAATQQRYFPEWLITGTYLTDTTFFGRTYDPPQWAHAFGISPLPVFWEDISQASGYRRYHHMKEGSQPGDEGTQISVREPPLSLLFSGIHNAGPNLSPETFAQGLRSTGKRGGLPHAVSIYFNEQSYTAIKDFAEVFWDPSGRGKDETGKDAAGLLLKADGGKRYEAGTWPAGDVKAFDRGSAVFTITDGSTFHHDADGHRHSPNERCRSCG